MRFSNMRADRNRYEFELKARRIEISWIFMFSLWNLMEFYEMLWQILISLINFWSILINFERGNGTEYFRHCLAGYAPLIFLLSHHGQNGPRWPLAGATGGHFGHNGTTKKSRVRVSQYPAKQWHIFLNFCVFIRRVIKANMLKHVFLIRLHTSTHIYTHLHTPTYTCMHIHAPTCTYIHLHTPKYTYIHRLEYTST